jgi:hypothetical protein
MAIDLSFGVVKYNSITILKSQKWGFVNIGGKDPERQNHNPKDDISICAGAFSGFGN